VLEGFSAARHALAGVPADLAPRDQQPYDGPAIAVDWTRRPPYAITPREATITEKHGIVRWVQWLSVVRYRPKASLESAEGIDTPDEYPAPRWYLR
jgi:hypothetical protein